MYRSVQLSFWTDNKVLDEFTPEDKYFYLYLLTNPQTNLCGCYEISYKSMVGNTGYNKDTCIRLLERFDKVHNVIKYNEATKEVLIVNWHKYNWSTSEKTLKGVEAVAKHIKCEEYKEYVLGVIESIRNGGELPTIGCPIEASVSDTATVAVKDSNIDTIKDIINYLNDKCGTNYRHNSGATQRYIKARLKEGYTLENFKVVIDKKSDEWIGTEWEKYLRPETLFGSKFAGYLNQKVNTGPTFRQANKQTSQLESLLSSIKGDAI